jgi:O-antigen ligase
MLSLILAFGAMIVAPRRVIMEFPISFSILGIFTVIISSIIWTVDSFATGVALRALIPAMLGVVIVGGLLTLKDVADALIWAVRIGVAVTYIGLIIDPTTRLHVGVESGGVEDYAGWHGYFNHKNNMAAFLVLAIPTILIFHRNGIIKWGTLGAIGVLLVGSTSATGVSAAFFVVVAWVWLTLYHNQAKEDTRDSTLLFLVSVVGALGVIAAALSSIATITSAYGKDTTFSGRTQIWEASFDAFLREPWLGYGFSALFFREQVSPETAEIWRQVGFANSHAHNGPLDTVLQIGLVGLAIFLVLWISTARRGWNAISSQPDLGIWIVAVMSANMLMALSEDAFSAGWIAVFALMKMLLMRRDESLRRPGLREATVSKWAYR